MIPKVLFIVTGDPRFSPRPAEALRIAAGVGVWKKTAVSLYLRETAVLALCEYPDDFIDSDHYTRYLPMVAEWKQPVYVQHGAAVLAELGEPVLAYQEIDDDELAQLAARQDYVLRF